MSAAHTRYCPGCGGPNGDSPTALACTYCHGPLVPLGTSDPRVAIRCQGCATSVPGGSTFCADCGTAIAQTSKTSAFSCPGCAAAEMVVWGLAPSANRPDGVPIHGCRGCGGVWIDAQTLQMILQAASAQAPMSGHGTGARAVRRRSMASGAATAKVVYRKCPACERSMLRRNFARISGVIVDECKPHGTYFDAGELEDILDFVRSGGLAEASRKQGDEDARIRKAQLQTAGLAAQNPGMGPAWLDGGGQTTFAFTSFIERWVLDRFRG